MPAIDLFAGLKVVSTTRGKTGGGQISKATVEIKAPTLLVNLNEPELAGAMSQQVVTQLRENILGGARLDGTPAAPLAASTIIRREYRVAQGQRGGALSPVRVDKTKRAKGRKNWRERFKAPKAGEANPASSPAPISTRGVESGLLLRSLVAVPTASGSWTIYVANNRSQVDGSGSSPIGRAFGMQASGWSRVVTQPAMRKRLQHVLQTAIGGKSANLLAELEKTARLAGSIANEAGG